MDNRFNTAKARLGCGAGNTTAMDEWRDLQAMPGKPSERSRAALSRWLRLALDDVVNLENL